ncbi:hypothetical protein ABZ907_20385 [Nonomuraea wenchangensis]
MNTDLSSVVAKLKWLRTPRTAWKVIAEISGSTNSATVTVPSHHRVRRHRSTWLIIQASVSAYRLKEAANLNGLSHTPSPMTVRPSTTRPTALTDMSTAIATAQMTSGPCQVLQRGAIMTSPSDRLETTLLARRDTNQRRDHQLPTTSS